MLRLTKTILLGTALTTAAACGGDDDDDCVGHDCVPPGLNEPEGGQIIFEYIYFDTELQAAFELPQGVTTAHRVMAYFMNSHSPQINPLPTPGVCNNLEATRGWPLFVSNQSEHLDVGTLTIKGKNEAGADISTVVPKQGEGIDQIGRAHPIFYQNVVAPAGDFIRPDAKYTVEFSGSDKVAATTFTDTILMANTFDVMSPGLEDDGPLVAGTDFPVRWTPSQSPNIGSDTEVLGITWLVDATGKPTHMCPTLHSQGEFTIPGAAITEFRAIAQARGVTPDKMILLRNSIVHTLERLPNNDNANERRIDMLSVMCWAQLMDTEAAAQ
jgi:hypothetical protein